MKKILLTILTLVCTLGISFAADTKKTNNIADNIVGEYEDRNEPGDEYRVRFTKNANGTYSARIIWIRKDIDPATGDCWKDTKNPDKSLRNRYTHDIYIIEGLKYNAEKKQWDGAKIYDPDRGIKANVTCKFTESGDLQLRGTVLGIGETVIWNTLK